MNDAYKRVQAARQKNRTTSMYYISHIFDSFLEMHGDRPLLPTTLRLSRVLQS